MDKSCADRENFSSVFSPINSARQQTIDHTIIASAEPLLREESFSVSEESITEDHGHPETIKSKFAKMHLEGGGRPQKVESGMQKLADECGKQATTSPGK